MKSVRVTLVKSPIGYSQTQRETLKSLGLTKINKSKVHNDKPHIRGMLNKVKHMVKIEEINGKELEDQ